MATGMQVVALRAALGLDRSKSTEEQTAKHSLDSEEIVVPTKLRHGAFRVHKRRKGFIDIDNIHT